MYIHFNIHFVTKYGEKIQLLIQTTGADDVKSKELTCDENSYWNGQFELSSHSKTLFYKYVLVLANGERVLEPYGYRTLLIPNNKQVIDVKDYWRNTFGDRPFMSTAFQDCYFKRSSVKETLKEKGDFVLQLFAPQIEPQRHIAMLGNQDVLGNWDVRRKVKLKECKYPLWSVDLFVKDIKFPLEYKYVLVDSATDVVLAWEVGPNRYIHNNSQASLQVITDENFVRDLPSWQGAGVAIPIFSLRSNKGVGIGEFLDLKLLVDWAKLTGQRIIQTLPINDTIRHHDNSDSYPYNAVSVYALHPIYLNLDAIGQVKNKERKAYFAAKKKQMNALSYADYQQVLRLKWEYCREVYADAAEKVFNTDTFKSFFNENSAWLVPYAVFSYLRDKFGTPDFKQWPLLRRYNQKEVEALASPAHAFHHDIAIHYFVQFHLDKQLVSVHNYARSKGITIKGDIPIGVSPQSVDTWMEPELFNTLMQAGAPPDDFSVTGQNWGFPTYNWELMAQDHYQWWTNRFRKLAAYFDAYRIDHILGFFRIWEIPQQDVWGLTGSFNPSLPLTINELESKGLLWDEDRYTKPYLKEHVIQAVFNDDTKEVLSYYFVKSGSNSYRFKKKFDTQKKIANHFHSLGYALSNKDLLIRNGLYSLHSEVLFIHDVRQPAKVHPRIAIHNTASFRDLPDEIGRLLDEIYVDYYYHRHNAFWRDQAMQKLPALIASTNMLVCGEDLGMVPDTVPEVMQQLELLSLEIQRMPKNPQHKFAMPCDAPYLSVCTTSTHDMSPIRAWWLEDRHITQRFYNHALGLEGSAPVQCEPRIAERIVQQHLASNTMLVILPWQDWIAIDGKHTLEDPTMERINVPSNPDNFWCYRMHISLEKLMQLDDLNMRIKTMIKSSGR